THADRKRTNARRRTPRGHAPPARRRKIRLRARQTPRKAKQRRPGHGPKHSLPHPLQPRSQRPRRLASRNRRKRPPQKILPPDGKGKEATDQRSPAMGSALLRHGPTRRDRR